jgi:DNA-binding NtrC family response regulator
MIKGRIIVIDDEVNAASALETLLREDGYEVSRAHDARSGLALLEKTDADILLTDLRMPGMDGLELMRKAQAADPELATIVMTAHGAIDTAVAAMRQGAADYVTKPLNMGELSVVIERVLERQRLRREAGELRARLADRHRLDKLVGTSAPMKALHETILQVAPSRASVLITGESGTGKELIAAAIHQHSPRASRPFVKLHCAALAESILESELFGHEKGSFTGALARKDGRFSQADGGTLFLDEIGEISPSIQVKLLRFLQEREFERVGGTQTVKVDVRIVAATNRDLPALVKEGKFREDLYYRLNVVPIEVPPLRARPSDILVLAAHFLKKYGSQNDKELKGFSDEALAALSRYPWPGNVRELENAIERAVVIARGNEIGVGDLSVTITSTAGARPDGYPAIPGASMAELERFAITRTLEHTGGSTSRAAEILGISARKIQYRLHEYSGKGAPAGEGGEDH